MLQGSNLRVTAAILKVTHYSYLESPLTDGSDFVSQGTLTGYNSQQLLIISTNYTHLSITLFSKLTIQQSDGDKVLDLKKKFHNIFT